MKKKIISVLLIAAMTFFLVYYSDGQKKEIRQPVRVTGEAGHFTYSYTDRAPENWSPLMWTSSQERDVLSYTASPLYAVGLNEERDGYTVGRMLAAAMPKDVTEDYAGSKDYSVPDDAKKGYAWQIQLRKDAVWADQTAIRAADFVKTIKLCLDSEGQHGGSADFCSGTLTLANAKAYTGKNMAPVYVDEEHIADVKDSQLYINLNKALPYLGDCSFAEYYQYYSVDYGTYFTSSSRQDIYERLREYAGEDVYVKLDDSIKKLLIRYCRNRGIENENAYRWLCFYQKDGEKVKWNEVGAFASGKYTLTLVLEAPTTKTALACALRDLYLVNSAVYDTVGENYGTAADSYISYGPYTIASYDADRGMVLKKNDSWFGYSDKRFAGQYQTTDIQIRYDLGADDALELFEQGNLQRVSLDASASKKYSGGKFYCEESAVGSSMYVLDASFGSLEAKETVGENHRILAYKDFRHAISLVINRSVYVQEFTMGGTASYGLFNDSYFTSVRGDSSYRSSGAAKSALANLYGLKDKKDVEKITGFDIKKASNLLQSAYDVCLEDGNISDTDQVCLTFEVKDTKNSAEQEREYLQRVLQAAAMGTDLQGRISIGMVTAEDSTPADICKTTWYGDIYDPYTSIRDFCSSEETCLNDFTPAIREFWIELDGERVTHSVDKWQDALVMGEYRQADAKVRNSILGNLERRALESYMAIPLYEDSENCLYSRRIANGSKTDVSAELGYGGVRYMAYSMDDAEWADYCGKEDYHLEYIGDE